MDATQSNSKFCPSGPPELSAALLSVSRQSFSAVTKRAKKPTATSKLPRTRKQLAFGSGKLKLTVSLALSSSAKPASSSRRMSPFPSRPKRLRPFHSSASPFLRSGDVDDEDAMVLLSDRDNFSGEASS